MTISEVIRRAARDGLIRDEPPPDVATVIIASPDGVIVSAEITYQALGELDKSALSRSFERLLAARERVYRERAVQAP